MHMADPHIVFPDEESARRWFEKIRWPNGEVHCPKCLSHEINHVYSEKPMPYRCSNCRVYFNVKFGTPLNFSRLPLRKWAMTIYVMAHDINGTRSVHLHRDLDIRQGTAWNIARKIRLKWMDMQNIRGIPANSVNRVIKELPEPESAEELAGGLFHKADCDPPVAPPVYTVYVPPKLVNPGNPAAGPQ